MTAETTREYVRAIEASREESRQELRSPRSPLAAVARHELQLNTRTRFGPTPGSVDVVLPGLRRVVSIVPTEGGFRVDDENVSPGIVKADPYLFRLSHQGYPAVVVLDRDSPRLRELVERRWFPVDERYRIRARLERDPGVLTIASTASAARQAERVGHVRFVLDGTECELVVARLLEPGVGADQLDCYFRDATTGRESYEVGRYVAVDRDSDDVIVDFNLAYNPSCALSPFYNCPIPPAENRLAVPIRAGEMTPLIAGSH